MSHRSLKRYLPLKKDEAYVPPVVGWHMKTDPKLGMIHFNHSLHGTVTIKKNPNARAAVDFPIVAIHNQAGIGRYKSSHEALSGVKNYIQSLKGTHITRFYNRPIDKKERYFRSLLKADMSQSGRFWKQHSKIIQNKKNAISLGKDLRSRFENFVNNTLKPVANLPDHPDHKTYGSYFTPFTDRKGNKANVVDFTKAMLHIAGERFKENPDAFKPTLNTSNEKLSKDGIAAWSLPAVKTCPGAGDCPAICYAESAQRVFWDKLAHLAINHYAVRKPDFVDEMDQLIKDLPRYKKGGKDWSKRFRMHDYGDFFNPDYAKKMGEVARRNPQTTFYGHTKSYAMQHIRDVLFKLADELPNFVIRQSIGSRNNSSLDPARPMTVIAEKNDQQYQNGIKGGLVPSMDSDIPASDPKNHIILLEAHGAQARKHNLEKHLAGLPSQLRDQLLAILKHGIQKSDYSGNDSLDISDEMDQPDRYQHVHSDMRNEFKTIMRKKIKKPNLL